MNKEWDKNFIGELAQVLAAFELNVYVGDIEGTDSVVIEADGEKIPAGCTISVEHYAEDAAGIYMFFPLYNGLDEKAVGDMTALVRYMNKYLTIGCFTVNSDDNELYYHHAFIIDEDMDKAVLFGLIGDTLDIATQTAAMGADITAPVLDGTKSVSELLNDEYGAIYQ